MSVPLGNPEYLWELSPNDFNEWRANHDLPLVFQYFLKHLPGFGDWAATFAVDSAVFCQTVSAGDLFIGQHPQLLVEHEANRTTNHHYSVSPLSLVELTETHAKHGLPPPKARAFTPYFSWAKQRLGNGRYIVADKLNRGLTESFVYNLWSGVDKPATSRAFLFKELPVLKLGGLTLSCDAVISGRNLDFVDLDYLTIGGDLRCTSWTSASFSSCRHIRIKEARLAFFRFYECPLDDFVCESSRIQQFQFIRSLVRDAQFADSRLFRVTFEQCYFTGACDNCDLQEVFYTPAPSERYSVVASTYRSLRSAYQSRGKRHEASECYYAERRYERKACFTPYFDHPQLFPPMKYGGRLKDVLEFWRRKHFTTGESFKHVMSIVRFHLKVWLLPKYALRAFQFKARYLVSLVEEFIWGYGERPVRIVLTSLGLMVIYAAGYYVLLNRDLASRPISAFDSVYFSVVTFTTLGYGDITPKTELMKALCASEAALGAFTIGLVVAGFANRSRY